MGEYRNPQVVKSEVREWHKGLESLNEQEDLLRYGMGSEALSSILRWLNEDLKLNLGVRDIIENLQAGDLPAELVQDLESLQSREHREDPAPLPEVELDQDAEDVELKIDNLLLDFGAPPLGVERQ